ncbi:hypothetical protein [Phreatobacter sp.]|uniref:hypothetical protein n=1 Tax=Phreatobacter sp. TaxID=1966341 RepID=UPI003F71CF91
MGAARLLAAALVHGTCVVAGGQVLACSPEGAEAIPGLRADSPLVLAAPDGRRFRLVALAGEVQVPASDATRLAILGTADRHGRLPVLALGADSLLEAGLLRAGTARLTPARAVPRDCWRLMEAAETEAVTARRGIWATAGTILDTNDTEALKARDGLFAVAEGRVRNVRTVNRITYVNFGPPGSGALTVTIHQRDMPAFRNAGLEPAAFRGQMLRVRGTVTVRRGPFIAAAMPEAITIAAAPVSGAR